MTGDLADELLEACPGGLFVLKGKGKSRSIEVTEAVDHLMILEKVRLTEGLDPYHAVLVTIWLYTEGLGYCNRVLEP